MRKKCLFGLLLLIAFKTVSAQYTLNGRASQNDCHCYTLTPSDFSQTGSIWNDNRISLNESFDFKFDIFLGCADADGADGIAFVLQPISTSVGTVGSGLGYQGVSPAVGVTIDTWQNGGPGIAGPDGDPAFDHIAIQLNGDLDHKDSIAPLPVNNIAGPVTAIAGSDNIEDCNWHILRVHWDAVSKTFSAYIDGNLRVRTVKDLVPEVFNGDPLVFWGFTGSTGGSKNLQQICTALKPMFRVLTSQKRCIGEPISFNDSTISFAPLQKFYWDFGDSSPVDSINLNPVHTYSKAGIYTIVQTVLGADGCIEKNSQQITIGSLPLPDFNFSNACKNSLVTFNDSSTASFGTINQWHWDFGDGGFSELEQPTRQYTSHGVKKVRLAVSSIEGCQSDTIEHFIQVYEKPTAGFSFLNNRCSYTLARFNGVASVGDGVVSNWIWKVNLLDVTPGFKDDLEYTFTQPGTYPVSLVVESSNGCFSDTVTKEINIIPGPVANFRVDPPCLLRPVSFYDSSQSNIANPVTGWWWQFGNGLTSNTQHPTTTYGGAGDQTISLVVTTLNGCTSDTLHRIIDIESTPIARFSYSQPLCTSVPARLSDSSSIENGTIKSWQWIVDNVISSDLQNPAINLAAGNHVIKLVAFNSFGCASDTSTKVLFVNPRPVVDFIPVNACINLPVALNGIARSGSINQWKWIFDDDTSADTKNTTRSYPSAGIFPVKLFGVAVTGCITDTLVKNVEIYSTNAFAGNDTIAATSQPIQLQGTGGINYEWTPAAGLDNPFISNPVATNLTDRRYVLKASTPVGCSTYDTILIKIYNGPEIYVPKAFSPNNDGKNELLKAIAVGISEFKYFTVYNRFGQVMFSTTISNMGWDGFYKGRAQNTGAYTWIASAMGYHGVPIFRKGTVLLLR